MRHKCIFSYETLHQNTLGYTVVGRIKTVVLSESVRAYGLSDLSYPSYVMLLSEQFIRAIIWSYAKESPNQSCRSFWTDHKSTPLNIIAHAVRLRSFFVIKRVRFSLFLCGRRLYLNWNWQIAHNDCESDSTVPQTKMLWTFEGIAYNNMVGIWSGVVECLEAKQRRGDILQPNSRSFWRMQVNS